MNDDRMDNEELEDNGVIDEKYPEKFQNNRSLQYRELVHKRVSADGISEPSAEWRGADLAD